MYDPARESLPSIGRLWPRNDDDDENEVSNIIKVKLQSYHLSGVSQLRLILMQHECEPLLISR